MSSYGRYIKKSGRFLAYKDALNESDYWEMLELTAEIGGNWYWADDVGNAKAFTDTDAANKFLLWSCGAFWGGAEIVNE